MRLFGRQKEKQTKKGKKPALVDQTGRTKSGSFVNLRASDTIVSFSPNTVSPRSSR